MIKEEYRFLFIKANIKFYTNESKRLPTFYFESDQGFKGRVRQKHHDGPKISFQGKNCIRRFAKKDNIRKIALTIKQCVDNDIRIDFRNELLIQLTTNILTKGYHVVEYLPTSNMYHISGGVVDTNQTEINNFDLNGFIASNKYKFSADWG